MVEEAEEFAEQDKKVKGRVDARNQLETYCYNMKTTIEDKLGDKVEPSEKEKARALLGPRGRRVGLGSCGPRPAGTLCAAVAPLPGISCGGYSEAAARARPRPGLTCARAGVAHRSRAHPNPAPGARARATDPNPIATQVKEAVAEAIEWLDENQEAEEDEYKDKLKEVEDVCNPIVSAAYAKSGGAPGGADDEDLDSHDEL